MADKISASLLLNTDDDFNILLEALDAYAIQASSLSYAFALGQAALDEAKELPTDEEVSDKQFQKAVDKRVNKEKVRDNSSRIRDRIIVMKAKVVLTKEYLRGAKLEREIDNILGNGV